MPVRTKAKVVIAFASRLLLIAPSASRLRPMHTTIFHENPSAYVIRLQVMSLLACQVSVISATVPCAKPFFSVFSRGIMSRPRASILPSSRPTMLRMESCTRSVDLRKDRGNSIKTLHLQPERGVTFASAEHVPFQSSHRPSIVNSKHSDHSIAYSRNFEVKFEDVGGLLDEDHKVAEPAVNKCRTGSTAGFLWRRTSGGKSSQKSNAGSSQHQSPGPNT
jgi:hypothetical protein